MLSHPPPKKRKKFAPSVTGDINPESSHWNSGKMKIAYNSACFQAETFNFIFAQQPLLVRRSLSE